MKLFNSKPDSSVVKGMQGQQNNSSIVLVQYADADYYPPTCNQARLFAGEGWSVTLVDRWTRRMQVAQDGIKRYRIPFNISNHVLSAHSFLRFIIATYRLVSSEKARIVIGYDMHGFVAAYIAAKWRKNALPIFYQNHDIPVWAHLTVFGKLINWFELACVAKVQALILPNEGRLNYFVEKANFSGVATIVRNFASVTFVEHKERPKNLPDRYVLYQGAIGGGHCLEEIIESISIWPSDLDFVVIGPGQEGYKQHLLELAKALGVKERVRILAPVSHRQLSAYTAYAEVGLALYKERYINQLTMMTCSNKIYEYLACGVPVILNNWTVYRDFFNHRIWALFADPFDSGSIAKTIQEAVKDKLRWQEMSKAALIDFADEFNYEREFKVLEDLARKYTQDPL